MIPGTLWKTKEQFVNYHGIFYYNFIIIIISYNRISINKSSLTYFEKDNICNNIGLGILFNNLCVCLDHKRYQDISGLKLSKTKIKTY